MRAADGAIETRSRIVQAAADLLRDQGPHAVTTRATADRAGVQAPTIYRLFGDKDGLLEAVAEHVMTTYVLAKTDLARQASESAMDPLADLHAAFLQTVDFGVANPFLFRFLGDPVRGTRSAATQAGALVLQARIRRVAATGRLRVTEERAFELIQAAGIGTIQTLVTTPGPGARGLAEEMYQAVLGRILMDPPARADDAPIAATVAFRAVAPTLDMLTATERALLADWLDRAIAGLSADS